MLLADDRLRAADGPQRPAVREDQLPLGRDPAEVRRADGRAEGVTGSSLPAELEYRLRPAETVLWWGRPGRIAMAGRNDLAMLPVVAIVAATVAAAVFVPRGWHPAVTTIFRLAITASAISLIATHLTIVVLQRRHSCYAITRDRVLRSGGFWAGGFRAIPLETVRGVTLDADGSGRGTITLVADGTAGRLRLAHIADAPEVRGILAAAAQAAAGRPSP